MCKAPVHRYIYTITSKHITNFVIKKKLSFLGTEVFESVIFSDAGASSVVGGKRMVIHELKLMGAFYE